MEVDEAIKTAHHAVVEAGLPSEFQGAAFSQVLRHLLAATASPSSEHPDRPARGALVDEPSRLSRLAARVGVSESALADLFEVTDDSVTLHVSSARIPSAKSQATKDVALLVAAARQGSGADDGWTAAEHVREGLQNYKKYDTNNFSTYLKGVAEAFNFRGRGPSMELRLTQPGWEMAVNLITSLAGGA
jgi:AraC-like DNA-binding protein